VENPWQIATEGHNLSCFERNRIFLNSQGRTFLEISHLTGADHDGDSRGVIAADFRNQGMLDLVVRQCGGGPLLVYENQLDPRSYLRLSLEGTQSNRQGLGARVVARVGDQTLVREMYPPNGFSAQGPCEIHLGLGKATRIDSLEIQWPSGAKQTLKNLAANRHIKVIEGNPAVVALGPTK